MRTICRGNNPLPVFLLCLAATDAANADETRARDLGAESFLTKPIDFERLKRDLPLLLGEGT